MIGLNRHRYLLDASAVYPLILNLRERIIKFKDFLVILDLTIYEIGNAIWKDYRRGRISNPIVVARLFIEVLKELKRLSIGSNEITDVLQIAIENNLTFYDASYLYVVKRYGLKIVTQDQDLLKFPEAISVEDLIKIFSTEK